MDGSTSNFLRDLPGESPYRSSFGLGRSDGILYVEDFDAPPPSEPMPPCPPPTPAEQVFSACEVQSAHEAGRREGMAAALADAQLVQAQLQAAATHALADALAATRSAFERVVTRQADEVARTALAVLQAAIPHAMAKHAGGEIRAVIEAVAPGLRCEPELRVRTHPDLADYVRETMIGLLANDGGVLSVAADTAMAVGDLQICWEDGQVRRNATAIYADIVAALAPLGLPALEDICSGK